MGKMQTVSFRNVEEFLEYLPDDERKITEALRALIFECIPDVKEKLSYNVPFYSRHKSICFIWPASILWGKTKSYTGVRLGFSYGNLLNDPENYLDKSNRKQVYMKDFKSLKDIDAVLLKAFIYEAALVDKQTKKR